MGALKRIAVNFEDAHHIGDGKGYGLLAYDTTPNYTDTAPLPATPVKWKYKGIYRVGDQRVGLWSNEVSITVGG